jgi:hypothetical protein
VRTSHHIHLEAVGMNLTINGSTVKLDDRHAKVPSWSRSASAAAMPLCAPPKSEGVNSHV